MSDDVEKKAPEKEPKEEKEVLEEEIPKGGELNGASVTKAVCWLTLIFSLLAVLAYVSHASYNTTMALVWTTVGLAIIGLFGIVAFWPQFKKKDDEEKKSEKKDSKN